MAGEMGEFVMVDSDEQDLNMEVEMGEERDSGAVRWEEFLPKMMIRVLLVEADDSTRQIIAALLRKCNYQVAATSDGLKAWEILKRKHNNIDLILTEVDLPSISGYALLTLIMEDDGCRNIPVIMMSSSDSVSMVFKCMLKGAADFLIKPVRRNELKNLWQHVWRRLSQANNGTSVQNLNGGYCKAEDSSKYRATRNCSDGNESSSRQRSQPNEKDSNDQVLSQMKHHGASNLSSNEVHQLDKGMGLRGDTERERSTRFESFGASHGAEAYAPSLMLERVGSSSGRIAQDERAELASYRYKDNMSSGEVNENTMQAVDLIGTIDNQHQCTIQPSTSNCEMHDSCAAPQLELSLGRFNDPDNQRTDAKQKLNHSIASAFSRYSTGKNMRTSFPSSGNSSTEAKGGGKLDEFFLNSHDASPQPVIAFSSDDENKSTVMTGPTMHREPAPPTPGFGFGGTCPGAFGLKSTNQKELSPFLASTSLHSEQGTNCSGSGHSGFDETSNNEDKLASVDQQMYATGSASQSANSTMLTNEQFARGRGTHQNPQREAALAKFRLKRKERCYEKKVRYQSRKKLAEARPRVKGQFVRQVQTDQLLADTDDTQHEDDGG